MIDRALAAACAVSPSYARFVGGELLRQHRFAEAEALLSAAVRAFPRHAGVRARHALAAEIDRRFAEAVVRWSATCALQPDRATPWRGLAFALRQLGDIAGASDALARATALRPNDWAVLLESARLHDWVGRHKEAVPIWTRLVRRRPADPFARQGYAECLIRLDRLDEAARQIAAGFDRHPGHRSLVAAKGLLAMRRQDWDDAFAIWSTYAAAYPDDESGQDLLSRVKGMRLLEKAVDQPQRVLAPVSIELVEDEDARALMLLFESIGSDCEFGLMQRRYGAEPLGLLRWSDVTFPRLAAALDERFANMGEPETTEITVGSDGEICLRDVRWDLSMNTFLFVREVSPEALYPKMCRRVVYLRDKFLGDLAAGEKILVFKTDDLSRDDLCHLHALLGTYGPIRLLHVRRAGWAGLQGWPRAAAGEVVVLAPGLLVGYLSRIDDIYDPFVDEWIAVCRAAAANAPREGVEPAYARTGTVLPLDHAE